MFVGKWWKHCPSVKGSVCCTLPKQELVHLARVDIAQFPVLKAKADLGPELSRFQSLAPGNATCNSRLESLASMAEKRLWVDLPIC